MASIVESPQDARERNRTTYVSAGSSKKHSEFLWKMDANGALIAPDGQKVGAHRYFDKDKLGTWGTFVMTTRVYIHASNWTLEKICDNDHRRYIIRISHKTLIKYKEHGEWVMSADSIGLSNDYAKKMKRDETSRFVKLSSASAYKKPPTWILEFVN